MNAPAKTPRAPGTVLKVRKIGNSLGVILPKELLARLRIDGGDELHVVETSERGVVLSPYDPVHAEGMAIARKAFKTYQSTFAALAK
jgi:putative addiction module antidote